jgi:hypothetical protein
VEIVEERRALVKEGKHTKDDESLTAAKKAKLGQWDAQVKEEATTKFNAIQDKKNTVQSYDYLLSQIVRFLNSRGDQPLSQETHTETAACSDSIAHSVFQGFKRMPSSWPKPMRKKNGMANHDLHSVRADILQSTAGEKKGNVNSNTSRISHKMGLYNTH